MVMKIKINKISSGNPDGDQRLADTCNGDRELTILYSCLIFRYIKVVKLAIHLLIASLQKEWVQNTQ